MRLPLTLVSLVITLILASANAPAEEDCENCQDLPFLTRMPSYRLSASEAYDVPAGGTKFFDGSRVVDVEGCWSKRVYNLKGGATRANPQQIIGYYAAELKKKGKVLHEGKCEGAACGDFKGFEFVTARLTLDAKQWWIFVQPEEDDGRSYRVIAVEGEPSARPANASFSSGGEDCEDCEDLPFLTRMPHYVLEVSNAIDYPAGGAKFFDGSRVVDVEGRGSLREYYHRVPDVESASPPQIIRYHASELKKKGKVLHEGKCEGAQCGDWKGLAFVTARLTLKGKQWWILVQPVDEGHWYRIVAVEAGPKAKP